jgi:hypothetical protein
VVLGSFCGISLAVASSPHSIHPIQSSHQIILMYKLVVSERVGGLLLSTPNQSRMCFTNPSNFPLYARVKNLLESPGFMNEGIIPSLPISFISSDKTCKRKTWSLLPLCIFHTKPNTKNIMPQALQDIDMVFYSILRSLGLKPEVRPLFDISTIGDLFDDIYDEYGDSYKYDKKLYKRQPLLFAELLGFDREEVKRSRKFSRPHEPGGVEGEEKKC